MKLDANLDGAPRRLELELNGGSPRRLLLDDESFELDARELRPGVYSVLVGLRSLEVCVHREADGSWAALVEGVRHDVRIADPRKFGGPGAQGGAQGRRARRAPMPGKIVRVLVAQGDQVQAGTGILVVEAMKMQNEIKASGAGQVVELRVVEGELVAAGQVLATLE